MKICDSGAMSSIVSSISMLMLDFEQVAHIINSHLLKAGDSRCVLPLEKKICEKLWETEAFRNQRARQRTEIYLWKS